MNPAAASRVSAPALSDARARVAGRPKWTRPGARLVNGRACDGGVGIGDAAFVLQEPCVLAEERGDLIVRGQL